MTDKPQTPNSDLASSQQLLIRGGDYLNRYPNFKFVGRKDDIKALSGILMRSKGNSVLLVGAGGVGCTALCLGLQASKDDPDSPFDVINRRIFWLDTDGLFASGNTETMNDNFQKILKRLTRYPNTLLVIEDTRDFIEATRNNGCTHFINALMRELEMSDGRFKAIFETRDEDLEIVLKCHSNMNELFTMLDLREPKEDELTEIVKTATERVIAHHRIPIAEDAIEMAIELTSKYRVKDMSLSRAQPERTLNLLDHALTSYRQHMHAKAPGQDEKERALASIEQALSKDEIPRHFEGKSRDDLEQERADLIKELKGIEDAWEETQEKLRTVYRNQRNGEEGLRELEDRLEAQRRKDAEQREKASVKTDNDNANADGDKKEFIGFNMRTAAAGYESEAVNLLKDEISKLQKAIDKNKSEFDKMTEELNKGLELRVEDVLKEFSRLSGIPANKLNQDEREKLLGLDTSLSSRVFGQEHAVEKLADAVRVARVGLKDPQKPQASFMFLGPSGVGKTEIAKALTAALYDDERALLRFDMSEYMEKHAVAKLIGAPPGYEGYEAGGILTNAMRRNPYVVVLFDEIEKAHPDVFNVFLQVLDDGRLTDNRGLTVSFSEAIIIMTTNIGQRNFLDPAMGFDEAVSETMNELDQNYRPEFLNRFNGRENIVCFNTLNLDVIERIASREIAKLNMQVQARCHDLRIAIPDDALAAICRDHYNPVNGARGIPGYFATTIHPVVAKALLEMEDPSGLMQVQYNEESKELGIDYAEGAKPSSKNNKTINAA